MSIESYNSKLYSLYIKTGKILPLYSGTLIFFLEFFLYIFFKNLLNPKK
jgi:hypothetical protein